MTKKDYLFLKDAFTKHFNKEMKLLDKFHKADLTEREKLKLIYDMTHHPHAIRSKELQEVAEQSEGILKKALEMKRRL